MQKLDVREITRSLGAHMTVSRDETLSVEGATLRGPVHLDLKLTNAGSRILLTGRVRDTVELLCARCAQPFELHQDIQVHEEFLPVGSPELPQGPELHPEELNVFVYDEDKIDIEEVVRQNIISALPIQALCRAECAGLCTVCGGNRNETPCQCIEKTVDPRLQGLQKFLSKERP